MSSPPVPHSMSCIIPIYWTHTGVILVFHRYSFHMIDYQTNCSGPPPPPHTCMQTCRITHCRLKTSLCADINTVFTTSCISTICVLTSCCTSTCFLTLPYSTTNRLGHYQKDTEWRQNYHSVNIYMSVKAVSINRLSEVLLYGKCTRTGQHFW